MSKRRLNAEIKTRVEKPIKRAFERLARERALDASDLQREALREYLERAKGAHALAE